eukprot:CAMPEP_0202021028 /NCGR_PEP_ID=MMETSP0905-20130828/45913_1 /ASSEMBLY_ACC=CAM_ASM_000554 /TAXON_ID=420261 /ORGANISM="Thalassiosira antarctica, Strain CCMP982" /LENGTH=480 /DNA_ID=CAMNT_0048582783 /DNA_START=286 /DNA_END=1731 /DNA_ORIENTATION=-
MVYCVAVMAITIITQSTQTTAFSPSSLKPKGLTHATNSWKGGGSSHNKSVKNKSDLTLTRRTAKVSNFALSAASAAAASTTAINTVRPIFSPSNLAVSLDRPLLSPVEFAHRAAPSTKGVWSSFLAVLLSDVCKTALVAFLLAAGITLLPKIMSRYCDSKSGGDSTTTSEEKPSFLSALTTHILTPIQTIFSPSKSKPKQKRETYSTPMPFEGDGGWGKCTLRSKNPIPGSTSGANPSFTVYEFALPESYYTMPLALGQQLEFCCLSSSDDICTGSFYPYNKSGEGEEKDGKGAQAGVVRVVLPNDREGDEGSSKFMEVLRDELSPGDEIAIKPGKSHLTYHGKHVPVTDMVYLASGLGIVPILDQIKAITPKGSSSVRTSSVVWLNSKRGDFDLAMDELEGEYMKYPTKLAVSCIMLEKDDKDNDAPIVLEGNKEMEEAVPYFNAGTMAVVCGPKRFAEKARGYLMRKGYPENCICVLP